VTAPAAVTPSSTGRASKVVSRGRTDRRAVTLTFDAGSDRGYAERILDVLAAQHVTAAFGITGEWGNANRDVLARITREGHALINHSYDHSSFTGVSWTKVARTRAERESQLARTEQVFASTTGAPRTPYFRPPFGDYDAGVLADVGALGYPLTVMWSVDSMGWRGWAASQITQRCLEGAHSGAIYIFHVGSASRDADALPAIIEGLRARGYEVVPLAEILDAQS
jgi:peptidoglycan/xylan/chitin deacetylase (PgdA/CDA1 family)